MIVDDNHFISDSLKKLLDKVLKENSKECEFIQVTDGIEMIKCIVDDQSNGNLIRCIFTDENMEYINGSEAIRILRNLEKKNKIKQIKIISVSCQEDDYSIKTMFESGADLVLGKPISKNLIFNSLKDLKIF
jgi:CheY-like chemotaxis protein